MQLSDLITQTSQRNKSSAEKTTLNNIFINQDLRGKKPIYGDL